MDAYNLGWIRLIWEHRRRVVINPLVEHTEFWPCVRATIALLLNRWDDSIPGWDQPGHDVAWRHEGTYETDFGTGHAWATLKVQGFRVGESSDGSL